MPTRTEHLLRSHADHLDAAAPPISLDEILGGANVAAPDGAVDSVGRWGRSRLALVAASVVVAIGLTLALTRAAGPAQFDAAAVPPLPDDLPTTGIALMPEEQLTLAMATDVILGECMSEAGFDYVAPTTDELIAVHGQWNPHPVLGIRRRGAAERLGYQLSDVGGLGTAAQAAAFRNMTEEERSAYVDALTNNDDSQGIEIIGPDGQPTGVSRPDETGTCWGVVSEATPHPDHEIYAYQSVIGGESLLLSDTVLAEPRVAESLSEWRRCVVDAVTASRRAESLPANTESMTPDSLARTFASFEDVQDGLPSPTADEVAVAVADVECQRTTELQRVWAEVQADVHRWQLGEDVRYYDDLTAMLRENVLWATDLLADRGIVPPPLD